MSARNGFLLGAVLALSAGAAFAQSDLPGAPAADPMLAGPDLQGAAEADGLALFEGNCAMCHREANMITGMGTHVLAARDPEGDPMLEHRDILTAPYIALAVRTGIGNMPRISRAEVSDAQLAAIADYLVETAAAHEGAAE